MPNPRPQGAADREPTLGERDLMAAIGVNSVEALDRHLDGLLAAEESRRADRVPPQKESQAAPTAEVPWWLVGAGFGVGVAISGVLLALRRRSNA